MHRQYSMAKKLPAIVLCANIVLGLFSWIVLSTQTSSLANHAVADKSRTSIGHLVELIRTPLFNDDTISIQVALRSATEDPAIYSASFYNVSNELVTQSKQPGDTPENMETVSAPVELQNTQAGTVYIEVNSRPIYSQYRNVFLSWLLLWLLFAGGTTYASVKFAEQFARRLRILTNRLPGNAESIVDEISALEARIQPLLSTGGQTDEHVASGYYYSMVTATIKNRQRLNKQLNRENLELLFEKIDYCTSRALELYGGQRIEGSDGSICFYIRSTQSSKQHLLVCLMAVYSLQQLLERLGAKLGVDLDINWTLCSDNLPTLPLFRHHEGMAVLKRSSAELADRLEEGVIAIYCTEYNIEELSSIARFQADENNCFVLQGFPEGRQKLLETQILHLAGVCL
ncbi:hypothetical protein OAE16_03510 [Porticoccaceae bacterium]|nr:hypothetical protein [Porticoccaceae bacterium]